MAVAEMIMPIRIIMGVVMVIMPMPMPMLLPVVRVIVGMVMRMVMGMIAAVTAWGVGARYRIRRDARRFWPRSITQPFQQRRHIGGAGQRSAGMQPRGHLPG